MSCLSLRRGLQRSRYRVAVVLVVLGLGGAVSVHHGMPMGMSGMSDHGVCLAILGGVALLAVGVAIAVAGRRLPRPASVAGPDSEAVRTPCWTTPARAGPLYLHLEVLRL